MASRPLSKKQMIPKNEKNTPNPVNPSPISVALKNRLFNKNNITQSYQHKNHVYAKVQNKCSSLKLIILKNSNFSALYSIVQRVLVKRYKGIITVSEVSLRFDATLL